MQDFNDNQNIYLKAALSAADRKEYLSNFQGNMVPCLIPALDKLAASARKIAGYQVHMTKPVALRE